MTTAIVGPSRTGSGTPLGQLVAFPSYYPKQFTLAGETFLRTGQKTNMNNVSDDLQQFRKLNRDYSYPTIPSQTRLSNCQSIAPTGRTLLVGRQNGVDRSTDFGANWSLVTISGLNNNHLCGIGGDGLGNWFGVESGTGRVWRSTDDGVNWTLVSGVTATNNVHVRFQYLGNQTWICASGPNTLIRSTNNGANWSTVTLANAAAAIYSISTNHNGVAIAQAFNASLSARGYWQTADFGASWTGPTWLPGTTMSAGTKAANDDNMIHPGSIAFGENGIVIASRRLRQEETTVDAYYNSIWISRDNGVSFTLLQHVSGLKKFGSWETLAYIGDGKFIYHSQENESNGSARGPVQAWIINCDSVDAEILNLGENVSYGGQLTSGTSGNVHHEAITSYDVATGESITVVAGSGLYVFKSFENFKATGGLGVYTGGGAGGATYYQRIA